MLLRDVSKRGAMVNVMFLAQEYLQAILERAIMGPLAQTPKTFQMKKGLPCRTPGI